MARPRIVSLSPPRAVRTATARDASTGAPSARPAATVDVTPWDGPPVVDMAGAPAGKVIAIRPVEAVGIRLLPDAAAARAAAARGGAAGLGGQLLDVHSWRGVELVAGADGGTAAVSALGLLFASGAARWPCAPWTIVHAPDAVVRLNLMALGDPVAAAAAASASGASPPQAAAAAAGDRIPGEGVSVGRHSLLIANLPPKEDGAFDLWLDVQSPARNEHGAVTSWVVTGKLRCLVAWPAVVSKRPAFLPMSGDGVAAAKVPDAVAVEIAALRESRAAAERADAVQIERRAAALARLTAVDETPLPTYTPQRPNALPDLDEIERELAWAREQANLATSRGALAASTASSSLRSAEKTKGDADVERQVAVGAGASTRPADPYVRDLVERRKRLDAHIAAVEAQHESMKRQGAAYAMGTSAAPAADAARSILHSTGVAPPNRFGRVLRQLPDPLSPLQQRYVDMCAVRSIAPSSIFAMTLPDTAPEAHTISLRDNYVGPAGVQAVLDLVASLPSATFFDGAGARLTAGCIIRTAEVASEHPTLASIDISGSFISGPACEALLRAFRRNPRLTRLVMDGCEVNSYLKRKVMNQVRCVVLLVHTL